MINTMIDWRALATRQRGQANPPTTRQIGEASDPLTDPLTTRQPRPPNTRQITPPKDPARSALTCVFSG